MTGPQLPSATERRSNWAIRSRSWDSRGIGGDTITFTQGTVSGFNAQQAIADRAWIKTDATIAGGNSGGLAANAAGEIIGIPTIAASNEQVDPVDCRVIVDTNRDGAVDDDDTCVPIGGFLNGLRPIALALPLIEAATAGEAYVSAFGDLGGGGGGGSASVDLEDASFDAIIFADGVEPADTPTNVVAILPAAAPAACAFWDYEGMVDGVTWEALGFVNGELNEIGSVTNETWVGGPEGNWWACFFNENGLEEGLYELVLNVAGQSLGSDSIFVGGSHPLIDFRLENASGDRICFVQISPTLAANWGQDKLGPTGIVGPGETRVFRIPASIIDFRLLDCDGAALAEEHDLDATANVSFTLP